MTTIHTDRRPLTLKNSYISGVGIHRGQGKFEWDPARITLYRAAEHHERKKWDIMDIYRDVEQIKANSQQFLDAVAKMSVLNANVLDYLLENPHLIPEEWKSDPTDEYRSKGYQRIHFLGTLYEHSHGGLAARYIEWREEVERRGYLAICTGKWGWSHGYSRLRSGWYSDYHVGALSGLNKPLIVPVLAEPVQSGLATEGLSTRKRQ